MMTPKELQEAPALVKRNAALLNLPRPVVRQSVVPNPYWDERRKRRQAEKLNFFHLKAEREHLLDIIFAVLKQQTGFSREALWRPNRHQHVCDARKVAMCVAYELTGLGSVALGAAFKRHHTCILSAQNSVNTDQPLREAADKVAKAAMKQFKKR